MGVGVGRMCPEWLKGGRWPTGAMCPARAAALKGEALSCTHRDSSSKHSAPFLLFLDLLDIFRFRVWMPSFFMVRGLFTWGAMQSFQRLELPSRPDHSPSLAGGPLRKAHRPPGPPHTPCQERRREATAPAHRPCRSPPTVGSASEQRGPAMGGVLQQAAPLVGSPSGARFPSQATLGLAAQAAPRSTQRVPGEGRGATHIVQLIVEAAGVAHRVPVGVPAP